MQRLTIYSVVCFLFALLSMQAFAQGVTDIYLTTGQHHQLTRAITNTGNSVLQHPDPALGYIEDTTKTSQNIYVVHFYPEPGVTGVAEVVIQYYQGINPSIPVIETIRFHIAEAFVKAYPDFTAVTENSTDNPIQVLVNDSLIASSGTLSLSAIHSVQNGSASVSGDEVLFTPSADFVGIAYVNYVVCNETNVCDKAQVSVNVQSDAYPDTGIIRLSTRSNKSINVYMPGPYFAVVDPPENGTITDLDGDAWRYTPSTGFAGIDTIFFENVPGISRTVIITVYFKPKDNTYAFDDVIYLHVDEVKTFNVFDNDLSTGNYQVTSYSFPDSGSLDFTGNGGFVYTPPSGFEGVASFEYTSCFQTKCESADVHLYVGDMVPQNEQTYQLRTLVNTPLVLNYSIPLDGFVFNLQAAPEYGDLEVYTGYQTVQLECEEVSGNNLVIYHPDQDFTGLDNFEIHYCLTGSGDCELIKVDVEVIDLGLNMNCLCTDGCVWPGDANANGQVDLSDLLTIGWQFGNSGEDRDYPDNTMWFAQAAEDWDANQPVTGMNAKYTDSNGDGTVDENDISSILDHYQMRHALVPEVVDIKSPYEFTLIPQFTELDSGDLAVIDIALGTETSPVIDMHGFTFSLNLPAELVDSSSLDVQFHTNSWLAYDSPSEQLDVKPWDGRIDAGFTRLNGVTASGQGLIGTMTFIVDDDIEGFKPKDGRVPIPVTLSGGQMMNGAGYPMDVGGNSATLFLNLKTRDENEGLTLDQQLFVFPNPAVDDLQVHLNGQRAMQEIQVFDLNGNTLFSDKPTDQKHYYLSTRNYADGLYILRVVTNDGVVTRKFEVVHVP